LVEIPTKMKSHVRVDLTQNHALEPPHDLLALLGPNAFFLHEHHGYQTPFREWIALQRFRLKKNFGFKELGRGCYQIFVED